jgi:DNA-binding transcriptional MocR family regulator
MERQTTFHLDLSTGVPDVALLPCLNRALEHFTNAAAPGGYLDDPVVPELVEILRAGWPYDAEEFTVVDGAMDALDLAARALVQFGDRVVIEHPCFPPLFDLLEAIGADIVGVPVDDQGLSLAAMRKALSQPVTAVFIQPRGQNPTGVSLSTARAGQLAGLLGDTTTLIIEDDLGPVATTAPISLGQWLPEQTLHVRGFSKSHGPDLRLAAVSGPARLIREIVGRRQLGQGWTSRLLQRILLNLLTDDHALSQIAHACAEYARRRAVLVTALAANGIEVGGTDGLNIWVPVHDESAAIMRLASQGIGVTPGSPFAVLPGQPGHIRITCGLLADGHSELAAQIAAAARTGGWTGAR